mmetsp:Transcript_47149/g.98845  ORF Transcript_47149/g.98845 Transcript_47149/m.98845 type:complete len:418 (-) Transcript_47149:185-1438(-)
MRRKPSLIFICAGFALSLFCLERQLRHGSYLRPNSSLEESTLQHRNLANIGITTRPILSHIQVCGRDPPIRHFQDVHIYKKYVTCPLLDRAPEDTTLLLLEGVNTFGRTGNNLIEFLHSLQYAKDSDAVLGIMPKSWPTHLLTPMWMAVEGDGKSSFPISLEEWRIAVEKAFCVKFIDSHAHAAQYREVIRFDSRDSTRDLFEYKQDGRLNEYIEFQGHIIRTLWRSYNTGTGVDTHRKGVNNMCSVIDAMFGSDKSSAKYSVVHSRSLEGLPGEILLGKISRRSGCDPMGALNMEPDYVKSILKPLGMLNRPILFLSDNQKPEILARLLADPEIGPNIVVAPEEASWVGGDITAALMSDVFIGNPASTFSGFIAKSRIALGYDENYLFRKKNPYGKWIDACERRCIFDHNIVNAMA